MISSLQALLARTLLRWSQKEAALKLGINPATLSNIETGDSDPPASRLLQLQQFYENEGVEFTERDGVRWKAVGMSELKGFEGFKAFIDDVYDTVKDGGDVCVSNVDERQFEYWQGVHASDYLSKMEKVQDLQFRVLIQEGDDYFTAKYADYRFLPSDYFTGVPTYVYGTKKAEILFEEDTVTVFVIDNVRMADAQRATFNLAWGQAREPV